MNWIHDWPGKSAPNEGGIEHPAAYHMLDVAAVAEVLIPHFGFPKPLEQALILLTALHDLGKIGAQFRKMLRGEAFSGPPHWQITEMLLRKHDAFLEARLGSRWQRRWELYAATAGHHGRPPDLERDSAKDAVEAVGDAAVADSRAALEAFCDLWPEASLSGLKDMEEVKRLSWWLSGFVSTADWIGSNADWFPPVAAGASPAEYLADARRDKVGRAVEKAGLMGVAPSEKWILDFPESQLRPMQKACQKIPLPDGPMLAVIEDETGAGKTEAAFLLAHRMLSAKKGRGIFFALPTMATADAMFLRARDHVGRMFQNKPSLALAHGRSGLSAAFRELVVGGENAPEDVGCAAWLADGRRRALLADVGVGTVDQILLAALQTKFQSLRHFALSSKILIIDEAHEVGSSPYMQEVLIALLEAHRAAGGSAILLSATLPLGLRRRFLASYGASPESDPAYPALTMAGGEVRRDFPQESGARGPVRVERLSDVASATDLLKRASDKGAACVWVRNSVDEAIAAVEALRAAGVAADLLHARFALCDRKRIEQAMLKLFGKQGPAEDRAGRVLVSSQVIESSLDLDFDVMISDLAPMASLIQRAGRLWRHMTERPRAQRPVPEPVLHVLSPDPGEIRDVQWLSRVLGRGAAVYPLDLQWRTAEHLFRVGRVEAPAGLRGLIEATHIDDGALDGLGREAPPTPELLEQAERNRLGKDKSDAGHALLNIVEWEAGFRAGAKGDADAEYPTRLGENQTRLTLARLQEGRLLPWASEGEGEGWTAWAFSELSVASRRLERLAIPEPAAQPADFSAWPEWRRKATRFCVVEEDGAICEDLRYQPDLGLMFPSPRERG